MEDRGTKSQMSVNVLRKRTVKEEEKRLKTNETITNNKTRIEENVRNDLSSSEKLEKCTFWLTRILLIRYIGFIYFVAFLVAWHQNKELLGLKGLLPSQRHLDGVKGQAGGVNMQAFTMTPSLIWLFDYQHNLDQALDYIAYAGLGLSLFIIINGGANMFIMFTLWMLYHSLVNVGQTWYGFGWESQLLESGFLAIFLCPLISISSVPRFTPTSGVAIWGYRWLIFRIMLGAGLIKIRGDQCWRDLTCMNYHYETQPVPNPMAYYMHQSPVFFHKFEVLSNHFVELVVPFLLLLPRPRILFMLGGTIQIMFQIVLIISGNLSFLNWLTILPSLACFDDASLSWMFTSSVRQTVRRIQTQDKQGTAPKLTVGNYVRRVLNISLGLLIAYLSIPVVQNLISSRQRMNTSFDPLRLVNTYGAFGSITKTRTEVIYQGTYGDPKSPDTKWEEYEFKCKPGKISRRPCVISPYHYRLDWLLWFAAFQNYQYNPWMITLAVKFLANDNATMSLIEYNPFEGKDPPEYIRVQHYRYKYTTLGSSDANAGRWWKRYLIGEYLPAVSFNSVKGVMRSMNIDMPNVKRNKRRKSS